MTDAADLTIDQLYERVEDGITWLTEHDESGFHFTYETGATPAAVAARPPKNWDAEKAERYKAYFHARRLWHELYALLEKRSEKEAT